MTSLIYSWLCRALHGSTPYWTRKNEEDNNATLGIALEHRVEDGTPRAISPVLLSRSEMFPESLTATQPHPPPLSPTLSKEVLIFQRPLLASFNFSSSTITFFPILALPSGTLYSGGLIKAQHIAQRQGFFESSSASYRAISASVNSRYGWTNC
jgi:hypothetical protein